MRGEIPHAGPALQRLLSQLTVEFPARLPGAAPQTLAPLRFNDDDADVIFSLPRGNKDPSRHVSFARTSTGNRAELRRSQ